MSEQSPHILHARRTLGACIQGDPARIPAILIGSGMREADLPRIGPYRAIFNALMGIAKAGSIPTEELVWTQSKRACDIEFLSELASNDISVEEALDSAQETIRYGAHNYNAEVLSEASRHNADEKNDPLEIRRSVIEKLSKVGSSTVKPSTPSVIIESLTNQMNSELDLFMPTGIKWLDGITMGGMARRAQWAVGGPEKMRKSAFVRNVVLGLLLKPDGVPRFSVKIVLLMFENSREMTLLDIVSMLAMRYLMYTYPDDVNKSYGNKFYHEKLNTLAIQHAMYTKSMASWPKPLQESISAAFGLVQKFGNGLMIYDRSKDGGGLHDLNSMQAIIDTHRYLYTEPSDFVLYVLDHLLLVSVPKAPNEFAAATQVAEYMGRVSDNRDAATIIVSQFNRSGKGKSADRTVIQTSNTSRVEQNAENYFSVEYPYGVSDDADPQELKVSLPRSRRLDNSISKEISFRVHPASGLILGPLAYTEELAISRKSVL